MLQVLILAETPSVDVGTGSAKPAAVLLALAVASSLETRTTRRHVPSSEALEQHDGAERAGASEELPGGLAARPFIPIATAVCVALALQLVSVRIQELAPMEAVGVPAEEARSAAAATAFAPEALRFAFFPAHLVHGYPYLV